ncbi:hypothetical protein IAD21_00973 [Abditibacteriota bacterium]|nr:hypothetical protein IAD21_00973 [Abditibacteriota bacterium]
MNTFLSWIQLSPYFLAPMALTSLIGFACYALLHWVDSKWPEFLMELALVLASVAICALSVLPWLLTNGGFVILVYMGVVVTICAVGTLAGQTISPIHQHWSVIFLRLLFATLCCTTLSLTLSILDTILGIFPLPTRWDAAISCYQWGTIMGAVVSPSAIPIFQGLWQNSHLRPGLDIHLDSKN